MTTPSSLSALLATIAATAVATTACKKTPVPTADDRPVPSASASTASAEPADWTLDEMKELRTTPPATGITVWAEYLDTDGKSRNFVPVFEAGPYCSNEADAGTSCQKERRLVDEHKKAGKTAVVAVMRNDGFEIIAEESALRTLLGTIDTPAEAAVLATFVERSKIWSPQCTGFTRTIVMQKSATGWELALERRVRKGKAPDEDENRMILDKKKATVRPTGEITFGPTEQIPEIKMGCGRSPGWSCASVPATHPRTAGEYLAHAAHLEAASVAAFERIANELDALGAPADLVARARVAADDERRHALALTELARTHGAEPPPFVAQTYVLRNAYELALDNAVEGCVNETFGALVLHVQALTAEEPVARHAFASIAADEARHAELSAHLDEWLAHQISNAQRELVRGAMADAWTALSYDLDEPPLEDDREVRRLGLPNAATARALYEGFAATLVGCAGGGPSFSWSLSHVPRSAHA